jgi:ketosteroid isomerase-like protein
MTVEETKQIARRAFETLMAGDLRPLEEILAQDAVLHQCGFLDPLPAHAVFEGGLPGAAPLTDRHVQLERIIGEGNLVALHWRTTARYTAVDEAGLDGLQVSFPSMSFLRMENGKIAEIWNIQDMSTLETQIRERADSSVTG